MKSYEDVIKFHGHSCPGLAMGYRVSLAALREMKMENISEDEELVAIVENDSCAVDAIQVMTGCTFGKGNLIFRDYGKQVYSFIKRPSGDAVRISIDIQFPDETEYEKEMWRRYSQGDRAEDVIRVLQERKSKKIKIILDSPDSVIFKIQRLILMPPQKATIYQSLRCQSCGEKVAEPKARLKDGKILCIPCFEELGSKSL